MGVNATHGRRTRRQTLVGRSLGRVRPEFGQSRGHFGVRPGLYIARGLRYNGTRGRLAQWESASLTRKRSLVQSQYRPYLLSPRLGFVPGTAVPFRVPTSLHVDERVPWVAKQPFPPRGREQPTPRAPSAGRSLCEVALTAPGGRAATLAGRLAPKAPLLGPAGPRGVRNEYNRPR